MVEKLSPERAVRLLRAKAGELEQHLLDSPQSFSAQLAADIALIAQLLADHIEHNEAAVAKAGKTAGRAVWPRGNAAPGPGQPGDASDAT